MSEPFTVLISSAGRRVALVQAFREALRRLGLDGRVLAADVSPSAPAMHLADGAHLVPPCASGAFVPALLDLCAAEGVRLVVPTTDREQPSYVGQHDRFAAVGTTVAACSAEVVEIVGDKVLTHAWLEDNGFPTVRQAPPAAVLDDPGSWPFPLVVKPRFGSAGIGVAKVDDPASLRRASSLDDCVVQDVARGSEHTVDVLVGRDGRARCAVPRRRVEVRAGEVSKAVTVADPGLEALAAAVAQALPGAYGAVNVQVFADGDAHQVIEVNARFGGGFPLSWRAGADFPRWMIEELLGLPSSAGAARWQAGLAMLRYDEAVYVAADDAGLAPP